MARSALPVLVAATLVLVLSAGDADADYLWTAEQVLTFYFPPPATIIAGPGTGSTNMSDSAFGSLVVFDVPAREGLDNTSKSFGQCRGGFLVDSYDGTNGIVLFTINFTSHAPNGSVVIAGDFNVLQPNSTVPIIGGSGEFSDVKGYLRFQAILPQGRATTGQVLDALFYSELHYRLHRPQVDIQEPI